MLPLLGSIGTGNLASYDFIAAAVLTGEMSEERPTAVRREIEGKVEGPYVNRAISGAPEIEQIGTVPAHLRHPACGSIDSRPMLPAASTASVWQ